MQSSLPTSTANRVSSQEEAEHAANVLRSFGNEALAKLVEASIKLNMDEFRPVVVNDFSIVGDDDVVLLVPHGNYEISSVQLAKAGRYIIGLERNKERRPVLVLKGNEQEIYDTDTAARHALHVCHSYAALSEVIVDAYEPTVLETYFSSRKQFSDIFLNVEWRDNTDARNIASMTLYHGREWALRAFGRFHRQRNGLEKGLDAVHEGIMNAIDNTFRPLVSVGKKLDQMFGL